MLNPKTLETTLKRAFGDFHLYNNQEISGRFTQFYDKKSLSLPYNLSLPYKLYNKFHHNKSHHFQNLENQLFNTIIVKTESSESHERKY